MPLTKPVQILLADDDADDRYLFEEALLEVPTPTKLTAIEDGRRLMDYLSKIHSAPPPHIIFLDINMPMKTGKECLREIRMNSKFNTVPIVMFTTSSYHHDIEESFNDGANMFVSKSFFFEDDINLLERLFNLNWNEYLPKPPREKFVLAS